MGKLFATLGTKNCNQKLAEWKSSNWQLTVGETEVNKQLHSRKHSLEESLQSEKAKRIRLEQQVDELKEKVEKKTSRSNNE